MSHFFHYSSQKLFYNSAEENMEQEQIFEGKHLPFMTLKDTVENNKHLPKIQKKWIPAYPRPELHVFHLSHSTDLGGFCGIRRDGGFKDPRNQKFVWFSLTVSPQDLREAEDREVILVRPGGDELRVRPHRPQGRAEEVQEFRANRKRTCGDEEEFTAKKHRKAEEERQEEEETKEEEKPQEELTAAEQEFRIERKAQTAAGDSLRNIPDEERQERTEEREGEEEREVTKTEEEGEEERAEKTTEEQREERERTEEVSVTSETSKPPKGEKVSVTPETTETSEAHSERDFLLKFASSPSFSSRSRYGSFRFTFRIRQVLDQYKRQFCRGHEPVLRVFRTVLYKQEVMYAVLVHSPANNRNFGEFPLLEETPHCICAFRTKPEPHFIWRPQAMCGTHRFSLVLSAQSTLHTQKSCQNFFLWDHVTLALHVDRGLLRFSDLDLSNSLSYCEADDVSVPKGPGKYPSFYPFEKAEAVTRERWPLYRLRKFNQTHFHIPDFTPEIHKEIQEELRQQQEQEEQQQLQ